MEIYLKPIISACYVFPVLAVLFTLPYIIYEYHKYGSILVIRTGVVYTFIFYMITSYFMTVLPLPPIDSVTPDSACMLLVPFDAVRRVIATAPPQAFPCFPLSPSPYGCSLRQRYSQPQMRPP